MSSAQPNRRCDEADEDRLAVKARPRDDVYHPESFISCVCSRISDRSVSEGLLNPFSADSRFDLSHKGKTFVSFQRLPGFKALGFTSALVGFTF